MKITNFEWKFPDLRYLERLLVASGPCWQQLALGVLIDYQGVNKYAFSGQLIIFLKTNVDWVTGGTDKW